MPFPPCTSCFADEKLCKTCGEPDWKHYDDGYSQPGDEEDE